MAGAIGDKGDEVEVSAFWTTQQTIYGLDDRLDDVYILPLVESTNIIGLGYRALMEDEVDGACVVFYEEPVAYILTLAVDRKRFAMTDIIDEERNQFFRELVGSVVIGAVG